MSITQIHISFKYELQQVFQKTSFL